MNTTSKVLLGALAGAAVGATLGILFAPDKGSVTRSKIVRKSDEYAEELEGKFNEFVESMTDKFEGVREEAAPIAEQAKHATEEAMSN
jgi:gas vesicle protein